MSHVKPHFNESGGCNCKCWKCVGIRFSIGSTSVAITEKCICKKCTQDCNTERLNSVYALKHQELMMFDPISSGSDIHAHEAPPVSRETTVNDANCGCEGINHGRGIPCPPVSRETVPGLTEKMKNLKSALDAVSAAVGTDAVGSPQFTWQLNWTDDPRSQAARNAFACFD